MPFIKCRSLLLLALSYHFTNNNAGQTVKGEENMHYGGANSNCVGMSATFWFQPLPTFMRGTYELYSS
jgi:hypothetical protein